MNADGTDQIRLAEDVSHTMIPSWSPDGQKIAITTEEDSALYVINADGINVAHLTTSFSGNAWEWDRTQLGNPVWSPDGNMLAFASRTLTDTDSTSSAEPASAPAEELTGIYLINVDGTGPCLLTSTTEDPLLLGGGPVWSPDGKRIAFYDEGALNVIKADGNGRRRFLNTPFAYEYASPIWSPDGEKIAFYCYGGAGIDLCVINADGTEWTRLARNVAPIEAGELFASWGSG